MFKNLSPGILVLISIFYTAYSLQASSIFHNNFSTTVSDSSSAAPAPVPIITNPYQRNIFFQFFYNNEPTVKSISFTDDLLDIEGCQPGKPWLIIVHGFMDTCSSPWILPLVANFTAYRGGCIACMDYSAYGTGPFKDIILTYTNLTARFQPISNILIQKVQQFIDQGFSYDDGMLFGFSFGGQLVLETGRASNGQLKQIDACDPAGILFYPPTPFYNSTAPDYKAAKNVQCIHTSGDYGTLRRDCDQDWLMGDCGLYQPGGEVPGLYDKLVVPFLPYNHIICPDIYTASFEHNFTAVNNECCVTKRRANLTELPAGFKMGYMQKDQGIVQQKDLFALTFKEYPYNKPTESKGILANIESDVDAIL